MVPPPPNDTPPPTPSSPVMKLAVDLSPVGTTIPNISLNALGALMTSVDNMNKLKKEDSHESAVPPTPISATRSFAGSIKNAYTPGLETGHQVDSAAELETNTETSTAIAEDTYTPVEMPAAEPSPELTIDTFDELILILSFAILQLVQNIKDGDEAQLHSAVTDAQQKIRDHYIAVSGMKNIAAINEIANEKPGAMHQRLLVAMEGHKAEADGLRLSLHERSESLGEAIRQRDEVTETKNAFVRSLANEKRQRGEENVQLKAFKTEVDRLNAEALHATAYNAFTVGKMEQALKDADAAIAYKKTILKTLEKADRDRSEAKAERDGARAERDVAREERREAVRDKWIFLRRLKELENQQVVYEESSFAVERQLLAVEKPQVVLSKQHVANEEEAEKAKARRVAFEVLSLKYNKKKRKGPSGEEILRIPTP